MSRIYLLRWAQGGAKLEKKMARVRGILAQRLPACNQFFINLSIFRMRKTLQNESRTTHFQNMNRRSKLAFLVDLAARLNSHLLDVNPGYLMVGRTLDLHIVSARHFAAHLSAKLLIALGLGGVDEKLGTAQLL